MAFITPANRRLLAAVSHLLYSNPFLPDILARERAALGEEAVEEEPIWSMTVSDPDRVRANSWRIVDRLEPLLKNLSGLLAAGESRASPTLFFTKTVCCIAFITATISDWSLPPFLHRAKRLCP